MGLDTSRIALILRVIYGIDDNTFDRRLFPLLKFVGVWSNIIVRYFL